jgi:hypothetical protein
MKLFGYKPSYTKSQKPHFQITKIGPKKESGEKHQSPKCRPRIYFFLIFCLANITDRSEAVRKEGELPITETLGLKVKD